MIYWQQIPTTDQLEELVNAQATTPMDFVAAAVIAVGAFFLSRLVSRVVRWVLIRMPTVSEPIAVIVGRAAGWLLLLSGVVWALVTMGLNMQPSLIAIIIIGLIAFFAGRGFIENFSTGLVLQGAPMFAIGDELVTHHGGGSVTDVTSRTVVIETPEGEQLYIPNKLIIQEPMTNLTALGRRRSEIDVGVIYGTDLEAARSAIIEAALRCPSTRREPEPEVIFTDFGDNGINLKLLFWHDPGILERLRAIDCVGRSIANVFAERDITIAFPQRTLWWGDAGSDGSDTPDR